MNANELLKKGVPVKTKFPVFIFPKDFMFVLGTANTEPIVKEANEKFYSNISKIFGPVVADMLNAKNNNQIEVITDQNTLERRFIISPFSILNELVYLFDSSCFLDLDAETMEKIVDFLKNSSEEEIKEQFPKFCENYESFKSNLFPFIQVAQNQKLMSGFMKRQNTMKFARLWGINPETMQIIIDDLVTPYTIKKYAKLYAQVISKVKDNIDYFEINSMIVDLNNSDVVTIDVDVDEKHAAKLDMLIAYQYLRTLQWVNPEYQQSFFYYLSDFFSTRKDLLEKNQKLYLPDELIKMQDLYEEYQKILVNNPNLKIVDFDYTDFHGMSVEEVDEFINEYLKTFQVNWDIFSGTNIDEEMINKIKEKYSVSGHLTEAQIEQLITLFIKKKEFFDKTDPYYRLLGKEAFDGYVGYVYKNGLVVLEKFFENSKTGNIATESAIYAMDIKQFSYITKMSKTHIIASNLCKRFIHKGEWRARVSDYISAYSSDSNVVEEVSTLKQG